VIQQALLDATDTSADPRRVRHSDEARGWLTKPSHYLHFVATAAGLDADALRDRWLRLATGGWHNQNKERHSQNSPPPRRRG